MEERRKFVRLDTRLDVTYTVLPGGMAKGSMTKGVSGGGVCVFTEHVLSPGTRLQVALKLPGTQQPINFIGEIVWSEQYEMIGKAERRRSVETGLRFVELAPHDRETIMRHVILTLQPPSKSGTATDS